MANVVQTLGGMVTRAVEEGKPERARALLADAYSLVSFQARHFPRKVLPPARQYVAWAAGRSMAAAMRGGNVALCSIFLPCELLHAAGVQIACPEGLSCYVVCTDCDRVFLQAAEDHGVPETLCSYHRLLLGLAESGVLPKPKMILNTSLACDGNALSFRRLSEFYGAPRFTVDIPNRCDDEAVAYVAEQLRQMARFIEAQTGRKIEDVALRRAVARSGRTISAYERYLDARAGCFLSDEMTSELMTSLALHGMLGTPEAEEYAQRLARDTAALPRGRAKIRLLWVHTLPNWQASMKAILNTNDRVEIVGCDMAFDSLIPPDPDKPYESMARRAVGCSFNGPARRRIDRALEMAHRLKADGVVWFCHWGCKQTLGAAQLARQMFEAEGLPTLVLDGDGCDACNVSDGQMVTRLEAFLEQLEGLR